MIAKKVESCPFKIRIHSILNIKIMLPLLFLMLFDRQRGKHKHLIHGDLVLTSKFSSITIKINVTGRENVENYTFIFGI